MCGAGKSTTTREISRLLHTNSIPHKWYHEESRDHPLRITKKNQADAKSSSIDGYIDWALSHWRSFVSIVLEDGILRLIDGYVFQSTILNLILAKAPEHQVFDFFGRWAKAVAELSPVVVFLHKSDIKASFASVWPQRGGRWKRISIDAPQDVVLTEEQWKHYESQGLKDWEETQQVYHRLFREFPGNTISIDTTTCAWDDYLRTICNVLGIVYSPRPVVPSSTINVDGDYTRPDSRDPVIHIKSIAGKPYCDSFWPQMDMVQIDETTYELRSFPITLTFLASEFGVVNAVRVSGGYHWDLDGLTLHRLTTPDKWRQ